jgi:hypothetical protein
VIRILREPLFHFLIVGFVIALLVRPSGDSENTILVSQQKRERISQDLKKSLERNPTQEELNAAIDQWVEDEIIYREALKLGLDQNDDRIKDRLISKYRSMLESEVAEPSPDDVKEYYNKNLSQFIKPRRYILLTAIDTSSTSIDRLARLSEYEITNTYGNSVLSTLLSPNLNTWRGPFEVNGEQVFLKLTQILPPDTTSFEEARFYIPTTIKIKALRNEQSKKLQSTKESYTSEYE